MEDKGTSKTKYLNFNLLYVIRPITGYLNTHNPLSENFKNITPWLNLTFVIVPGNKITIVPSAFGKLRLECLNLSQNSLGKPNLSKWPWMEQSTIRNTLLFLDLSSNFLTRLPLNIGRLNNLKGIFISSNLLKELPQSIRNMHTLKYLYLRDNKFFYMPGIITLLDKLEVLSIAQNPLQIHTWKNKYKVLSLVELSANVTLQHRISYNTRLPSILVEYLEEVECCFLCGRLGIGFLSIFVSCPIRAIAEYITYHRFGSTDVLCQFYCCSSFCKDNSTSDNVVPRNVGTHIIAIRNKLIELSNKNLYLDLP